MRISLQGLTEEDYWDISQYKINFENFVDNIAYFYKKSRRGKTKIYIKIMDAMLKSPSDEKKFCLQFFYILIQIILWSGLIGHNIAIRTNRMFKPPAFYHHPADTLQFISVSYIH